jgi:drug/metabolite transporter (DMT)-like permease
MASRFRDSSLAVDAALVAVALMWASTFTLFKVAWREVDPVAFTAVRFGAMVVLAFGVLALSRDRIRPRRADLPLLAASGLLGYFLYQMGFILGLDRTTAVASAILIATHPIWAVVLALVVGRERPTRAQAAGIALGFLGVAVFLRAWDAVSTVSFGDLLALGAAACFGAYGVVTQPLSKRYPARLVMAYGLAVGGTLVALVGAPAVVQQDWGRVSGSTWLILVYATVGPVFLAYALWNWAIKQRGIARTVVYGFAVPVLAAALAVIGLGESIRPEQAVGAILIVAGLVITRLGHAPERPALEEGAPPVAAKQSEERARP